MREPFVVEISVGGRERTHRKERGAVSEVEPGELVAPHSYRRELGAASELEALEPLLTETGVSTRLGTKSQVWL